MRSARHTQRARICHRVSESKRPDPASLNQARRKVGGYDHRDADEYEARNAGYVGDDAEDGSRREDLVSAGIAPEIVIWADEDLPDDH